MLSQIPRFVKQETGMQSRDHTEVAMRELATPNDSLRHDPALWETLGIYALVIHKSPKIWVEKR
jgi:hypothetical protein